MNTRKTNRIVLGLICVATASICALLISFGVDRNRGLRTDRSFDADTVEEPTIQLDSPTPRVEPHSGYVSSGTCRECHQGEFDSWHRSFHRTMTQLPTPSTVVGRFENVRLKNRNQAWHLRRKGNEFWVDMVDPVWERTKRARGEDPYLDSDAPRLETQVVMMTGSHHRQSYWVSSENPKRGNQLHQFPWSFQIAEQKWIPLDDAFLQSPNTIVKYSCWSDNCINCHSVAGKPGVDPEYDFVNTAVAEFGISCEACHGPGQEHAEFYRNHKDEKPEQPLIVNPRDCTNIVSTQICGSCHSFSHSRHPARWWTEGRTFRPGQDLEKVRNVFKHEQLPTDSIIRDGFWRDGTVRTGGREYHGITMSACFQKGKLGCLSCHSMHNSEPDHQLANHMESNAACTACHHEIAQDLSRHTHHAADSSGSQCYNCHMPHTSYALLSVLRSHRIDSPSVLTEVESGRPNACNLCHLDKTLAWTDSRLAEWYGIPTTNLSDEQKTIAASLLLMMKGDAAQRVVAVGNFGLQLSGQVGGDSWAAPFLATLFEDPYSAVRWVSHQSLKKQSAFENFEFDYVGSHQYRTEKKIEAIDIWSKQRPTRNEAHLLRKDDGTVDWERLQSLLSKRDDQDMQVTE